MHEEEDDQSRVGPSVPCVAPAGSTAERQSGAVASSERQRALEEWIAHKPHCAVMGSEFRQPWREGDEETCNCGLFKWFAREFVNLALAGIEIKGSENDG